MKTSVKKIVLRSIIRGAAIALILMAVMVFISQWIFVSHTMIDSAELRISDAKERLEQSVGDMEILTEQLKEDYLIKTRTLAEMIELDPGLLNKRSRLYETAKLLNVDEIHVTDEKGVIRWTTVPDYDGFDMSTSEQARPFLKCIKDSSYELAQDPQFNGAAQIYFQYIGVGRKDKPGIVQIGMEPVRLTEALKNNQPDVILRNLTVGSNGTLFAVNKSDKTLAAFKDADQIGMPAADVGISDKILNMEEGDMATITMDDGKTYLVCISEHDDHHIGALIPAIEVTQQARATTTTMAIMTVIILAALTLFVTHAMKNLIIRSLSDMEDNVKKISDGKKDIRMEVRNCREFDVLSDGFNGMLDNMIEQITEINKVNASMEELLNNISHTSQSINSYSAEMKDVSMKISESSSSQAATVDELNETFHSLSGDVQDNARAAEEASSFSKVTGKQLKIGAEKMDNVRKAMDSITDYSHKIENIVKTIDDIAFQTNILALNASVEAARAGQAGKGFAVVAEEVRNLASKSAESASNTASLIDEMLVAIRNGNVAAESAAEELGSMIDGINKSIGLIEEISAACAKQAVAVREATTGMGHISRTAQDNSQISSSARETAQRLDDEAERLIDLVKVRG